jgi:hypothetical protein
VSDALVHQMCGGERRDVLVEVHVPKTETGGNVSIIDIACSFQRPDVDDTTVMPPHPDASTATSVGEAPASADCGGAGSGGAGSGGAGSGGAGGSGQTRRVHTSVPRVAVARPPTSTAAELNASRSVEVRALHCLYLHSRVCVWVSMAHGPVCIKARDLRALGDWDSWSLGLSVAQAPTGAPIPHPMGAGVCRWTSN